MPNTIDNYRLRLGFRQLLRPAALAAWLACILGSRPGLAEPLPERVEFNRDIRPILADACFRCHGPDSATREAELRLDSEAGAFAEREGKRPIVPGDLKASEVYRRINSADLGERMPPAESGKKLTDAQIGLLGHWIEQGAKWQKHWAFLPPTRSPLPQMKSAAWPRNSIDAFVLSRLEREGLAPAPEAERYALLRRVTLDLTGLPPAPDEVASFLSDGSPDAYERAVDRLLASPRFGERMAARWLDAARYADTSGYQTDGEREMWRWRDWVIEAYNRNLPFDQFTIEQLAGDLLPDPSLEQRLATGFNRNHRGNAEGGIIPEEYAVEYVVDRVETTATVWLGLTLGCTRCHDHKFDPFSQKEFYGLYAFFNNVPEKGRAVKYGNSPPYIKTPTRRQAESLAKLEQELAAAQTRVEKLLPAVEAARAEWQAAANAAEDWSITDGLAVHLPLNGETEAAVFTGGEPAFSAGRVGKAALFDGRRFVDAGNVADFGFYDKFTLSAWFRPEDERGGTILSRMTDAERADGYYLCLDGGKLQFNLVKRWLDDSLRVETEAALAPGRWHHVVVSYDGAREASGVRVYLNGRETKLRVVLDELNQSFATKEPLRIGGGSGPNGRFRGAIDEVRVYQRVLTAQEAAILSVTEPIGELLARPPAERSPAAQAKLREYYFERHAAEEFRTARAEAARLERKRAALVESFPTTMVMEELPTPRNTHLLIRGEYDKRGERVLPGVPAGLPPLAPDAPRNRLGLARWIVDPSNPLTARVAVNRQWQMFFGQGLVRTVDDFGSQGEWPTHSELLDWLAVEFRESGWDTKALARTIVASAVYRQSSRATPLLLARDPENRLLARAPRLRLSAQTIRDQALAAAGLLEQEIGGPSVRPYQPAGLWTELAGGDDYEQDRGANLYRRGLYTYWKRTSAPPAMITFDAAGRETCVVRETRTNTPLQALTLLNDVTFVEAARGLAERAARRVDASSPSSVEQRHARQIEQVVSLVLARNPMPRELAILKEAHAGHLARFRNAPETASALLAVGEMPLDKQLDPAELAALAEVAALVLNLDEAITRE